MLIYNIFNPITIMNCDTLAKLFLSFFSQIVTLVGLWLMPAFMSIGAGYVRMLVVWTLFSATSGYVMYKATRRRITGNTPR